MGRKPNTNPIAVPNLSSGSRVHWDRYEIIDNKNSLAFWVTCGKCGRDRLVRRAAISYLRFTGLCINCSGEPPPTYPGYKKNYRRVLGSGGYITLVVGSLCVEDQELCKESGMTQRCGSSTRVLEHRLIMARRLGRPLTKHEGVHHKNGIRTDNRDENLELRVLHHGPGQEEHDLHKEINRLRKLLDENSIQY